MQIFCLKQISYYGIHLMCEYLIDKESSHGNLIVIRIKLKALVREHINNDACKQVKQKWGKMGTSGYAGHNFNNNRVYIYGYKVFNSLSRTKALLLYKLRNDGKGFVIPYIPISDI